MGRVARTLNPETNQGAQHVGFTCGAFDLPFSCLPIAIPKYLNHLKLSLTYVTNMV